MISASRFKTAPDNHNLIALKGLLRIIRSAVDCGFTT